MIKWLTDKRLKKIMDFMFMGACISCIISIALQFWFTRSFIYLLQIFNIGALSAMIGYRAGKKKLDRLINLLLKMGTEREKKCIEMEKKIKEISHE